MVNMASMVNTVAIRIMQRMNKVDFHAHILPCIDDGSQSESQSYRMLQLEAANGVDIVLATPHFYPDYPSISEFILERQLAVERLKAYIETKEVQPLPKILLGAEVLLGVETASQKDLKALAIEGTDYILIEMPYNNWQEWVYEAIEAIRVKHKLIPVIAHVERYVPMHDDTDQIVRLLSMEGVLGQMNTRSLLYKDSSSLCHKLIANHMVHVLGSDAHRGQHLLEVVKAFESIEKKHGTKVIQKLHEQGVTLIQNQPIQKEMPVPFKRILGRFYK